MLFNSYIFIFVFLPLSVIGYFAFNHKGMYRAASVFLLVMSLWFYAYFNISYLPLILVSIALNYALHRALIISEKHNTRRLWLVLGIVFNLGLLFYYKYFDFFCENLNVLFSADIPLRKLVLPLGISFFTFQQLSLVIDSYKREVPEYGFFDYALFVAYFPQLIAGPIVTHEELVPQFADLSKRPLNWDNIAAGAYLFVLGLSKKVLIADVFGIAVNYGFQNIAVLSSAEALIVMLSYTVQIYFDFSGYCDMASGIAKMMNIDLPENFRSPYKADSITEFWRRWHMTLTRFFTKYIYFPLGGSHKGTARTCANIAVVFLASGIWHGAAWTFVVWGILHGAASVLARLTQNITRHIPKILRVAITFTFVSMAWVVFRAESLSDAVLFFERLFTSGSLKITDPITKAFLLTEISVPLTVRLHFNPYVKFPLSFLIGYFALAFLLMFACDTARKQASKFRPSILRLCISCVLLVWCIYSMSGVSTFLYFNF